MWKKNTHFLASYCCYHLHTIPVSTTYVIVCYSHLHYYYATLALFIRRHSYYYILLFCLVIVYPLYYYSTAFLAYEPAVKESHVDGKTKLWHFYR